MTTVQLNADILRNLGIVAEDESMLEKVAKYVRKLAKELQEDHTCMSKEAYLQRLGEAERDIAEGKGTSFTTTAEMNAWLNAL